MIIIYGRRTLVMMEWYVCCLLQQQDIHVTGHQRKQYSNNLRSYYGHSLLYSL